MIKKKICLFFLTITLTACAQSPEKTNFIVGKTLFNKDKKDIKQIIDFLKLYHTIFNSTERYKYWDENYCKGMQIPDYLLKSELLNYENDYKIIPNLVYIRNVDSFYVAQIAYHLISEKNELDGLVCVYNYALKIKNNSIKLVPLIKTKKLLHFNGGNFNLHLHNDLKEKSASLNDSLLLYNNKLNSIFEIEQKNKINCYLFTSFLELNNYVGLDVQVNFNQTKDNGYSDVYNKEIYCTNIEIAKHELVHLYVYDKFNNSSHTWFDEGIATFIAGSGYRNYKEHFKILKNHLSKHPEYNLNNLLDYNVLELCVRRALKHSAVYPHNVY
jgi:hypothetical protein